RKISFAVAFAALMPLQLSYHVGAQAKPATKGKYNVLFLISDDLRPELGSYGNPLIKTPNIDRIAKGATKFDRAYTQYPLCNPSRTSFLTGRYPTQHKIYNSNDYFRQTYPDWVTLPQYFQKHGYKTLRSGKIFHGGIDDQVSWTEGGEPTDPAITERGKPGARPVSESDRYDGNEGRVAPASNRASNSDRIIVLEGDGSQHGDYKTATRAVNMMERYKDEPFFLAVGFVKPHSPLTAPQSFFDLYDVSKMPLPVDFAEKPKAPAGLPEVSIAPRNADLFIGRDSPPDLAREMIRAYYASTSFMDAQVGRVLDALEKNGLRENTIIVFFGDHGYHLGEKGKWSKAYSLFEINLRVPLFIAVPNGKMQSTDAPVQLQDLYLTLADLCGLPAPPADIEGRSIAPLIKSPRQKWDYPAYSMMEMHDVQGHSVRKNNWHYVEYNQGEKGEMLFDITKDPHELKNLAADPKYSKVVSELRTLVRKMPTENK
ncbi:MAG TPA: sulfatase, partial [Pyrinomonadaceae bacterium]